MCRFFGWTKLFEQCFVLVSFPVMQTARELTRLPGLGLKPGFSQFGLFKPLFAIHINSLAELVIVICNKLSYTHIYTWISKRVTTPWVQEFFVKWKLSKNSSLKVLDEDKEPLLGCFNIETKIFAIFLLSNQKQRASFLSREVI